MTPEQLRDLLAGVAAWAARTGTLPDEAEAGPPAGPIFRPVDGRVAGVVADWVTPVAQRWAPRLDLEPRELARVLAQGLTEQRQVAAVEVAPTGLIAITLTDATRSGIIDIVLDQADTYALAAHQHLRPLTEPPGCRTPDDPVRAIQLSHARLCRLVRNARAAGVEARPADRREELTHVSERLLLVALADLPQRMDTHAGDRQQSVGAVGAVGELADAWEHPLRPSVVGAHITSIHGARTALAEATRIVLRNGLRRLGAAAPERM